MSVSLDKGIFMLSIDTELAWGGVHNRSFRTRKELYKRSREVVDDLLALLERYSIRATWAVVGHLFLDRCRPMDGVKHPEIVRPKYPWFKGDWFEEDPCSDLGTKPFWYGRDIVEKLLNCKVPQEVACHGFSHMIIGTQGCSREAFASELAACKLAARHFGVELRSFVYPRNAIAHVDVLAKYGYVAYRGVNKKWFIRLPAKLQIPAYVLDYLFFPPRVVRPGLHQGIWSFRDSYFYGHKKGVWRLVPVWWRVLMANRGLDAAVKKSGIFHLWFHEFNLASEPRSLLNGLDSIFQRVQQLRHDGKLENLTMGDLAKRLNMATSLEEVKV
jgi:peptidoglycan/xylan/chitin deacetylase (PgdA/CDA1 family)